MAFRILCIDGGGLRGIIPLTILDHLLKMTGRGSISDSFDLIAGTSTGGILACALSLKIKREDVLENAFSIEKLSEIYTKYGKEIFPWRLLNGVSNYYAPKYNVSGLEKVLTEYFGQYTLQDCKTPVLISAYDIKNYDTFYFTSRFVNPTSAGSISGASFNLIDICRATSAAPTFFSSHSYSYLDSETHKIRNFIDGGVFANNPSLAALAEILEHTKIPCIKYQGKKT